MTFHENAERLCNFYAIAAADWHRHAEQMIGFGFNEGACLAQKYAAKDAAMARKLRGRAS